jgi:hypothetical protein
MPHLECGVYCGSALAAITLTLCAGESHLPRLLQAAALLGNPIAQRQYGTPVYASALDVMCKLTAAKVGTWWGLQPADCDGPVKGCVDEHVLSRPQCGVLYECP